MEKSVYITEVTGTMYEDNELLENTTYTYQLSALNAGGASELSEIVSLTTLPGAPEKVVNISSEVTQTQTLIQWDAVVVADSYDLEINGELQTDVLEPEYPILITEANKQYNIRVRSKNESGTSDWSDVYIVYSAAYIPSNVVLLNKTYNSIEIGWDVNSNPGTVKYEIKATDDLGVVANADRNNEIYISHDTISGLSNNIQYHIEVRAINSDNIVTDWTTVLTVKTEALIPSIPSGLSATAKDVQISLFWNAVDGADTYTVVRDGVVIADAVAQANFVDTNLTPETAYEYKINASNSQGTSGWSQVLTKSTLVAFPLVPGNLASSATKTAISLTWDSVTNTTGYELEIDGKITNVGLVTSYNDNGLVSGSNHTYKVRARNSSGKSNWSLPITVRTIPELPSVPTNLSYTSTDNMATVEWDVADNADYYEVSVDDQIITNVLTTYLDLDMLLSETDYLVKVRAVNTGGLSEWSSVSTIVTKAALTNTPKMTYEVSGNSIELSWVSIEDAIGYEISVDGVSIFKDSFELTSINNGLNPGEQHTYKIRTLFENDVQGEWSYDLVLTTLPSSPSNLTLTPESNTMFVEWDEQLGAQEYQVEVDGDIKYTGTAVSWMDSSLLSDTTYTYRLRAGNQFGYGAWSDLVTIKTKKEDNLTPQNISMAYISLNDVGISWDNVIGATEYSVECNGSLQTEGLDYTYEGGDNSNLLFVGAFGQTYSYRVKAKFADGSDGEWSEMLTIVVPYDVPNSIEIIDYSTSETEISLMWEKSIDADYYEIEVDHHIVRVDNIVNLNGFISYTDTGLIQGSSHLYRIRVCNFNGSSDWSSYATLATDLGLSGVPTGFYGEDSTFPIENSVGGEIYLTWDAVDEATGYEIEDKNGNIIDITGDTEVWVDQLQYGSFNEYRIRSYKIVGNQNLMTNGDFSSDYQGWLFNWSKTSTDFESSYSIKTDINGDKYLNLKFERIANDNPSTVFPLIRYNFDGEFGNQYNLSMQYRVNEIYNSNYDIGGLIRLSPIPNLYFTPYEDYYTLFNSEGLGEWVELNLTNTYSQASYVNTQNGVSYALSPCFELYGYNMNTIGNVLDIDIKLISVIEDASTATLTNEYSAWSNWMGCVTALSTTEVTAVNYVSNKYEITWEAVENATGYDIEMDGVIIGETTETTYEIPSTQSYFKHIFKVRAKNALVESEWSGTYYSESAQKSYTVAAQVGEEFSAMIRADQVEHVDWYGMVLSFKTSEVEILDLCEFTPQQELSTSFIDETKTELYTWQSGEYTYIEVWIDPRLPSGMLWTGYMTSIKLRSKISGNINLSLGEAE